MTIVIGSIHDNLITMVADTQLSYDNPVDDKRTRHELLRRPTLKLSIVSPTLAVGFAGRMAADLTPLYEAVYSSPEDIAQTVETLRGRSDRFGETFIAATLVPCPTLWRIREGIAVPVTLPGRLEIGDLQSHELYLQWQQHHLHPASAAVDEAQALRMAVQWWINIDDGSTKRSAEQREALRQLTGQEEAEFDRTIGGYLTEIITTPSGFRYAEHTQQTLPDWLPAQAQLQPDGHLHLAAHSADLMQHRRYTLIGAPENRRAIGFCLPQARAGIFYPDGRPWEPSVYTDLASVEDMVQRVWSEHQQILRGLREPNYIVGYFEPADPSAGK
ncbi:hypothetical protein AB0M43_36295 [Longispora sp. NPDC051575]|uniref:hypothetical protein n=1 Tax=Longispora sp. NPDC051575 TaxID=3154943 RepID=UPI00344633A1